MGIDAASTSQFGICKFFVVVPLATSAASVFTSGGTNVGLPDVSTWVGPVGFADTTLFTNAVASASVRLEGSVEVTYMLDVASNGATAATAAFMSSGLITNAFV